MISPSFRVPALVRIAAFVAVLLALASTARAQTPAGPWFAGAAVGRAHVRFEPSYTFVLNGEPSQFLDEADGAQLDLLVGRRIAAGGRFGLDLAGTVTFNRAEWTLAIPEEQADFEYSMPYAAFISIAPHVRLGGPVSIFATAGAGLGRIRETKASPLASAYDFSEMTALSAIGGGVSVRTGRRARVFFEWRRLAYAGLAYDSHDPSGNRVEHIEDAPRARALLVGIKSGF